jgi:hypothetical protein
MENPLEPSPSFDLSFLFLRIAFTDSEAVASFGAKKKAQELKVVCEKT